MSYPSAPKNDSDSARLPRSADDLLPPVQAPSAGFLLQLFFIPLLIVLIIVCVWGAFSWIVNLGSDPKDLVKDIKAMHDASWQRAYRLSDLLRNPEYDYLKEDRPLAMELADVLNQEIERARMDENRINLRIYLCKAIGEFRVPEVATALVRAATTERQLEELAVRRTAVEGLAVLASNVKAEQLRSNPAVVEALLAASRDHDEGDQRIARADLRASAAFALGVLGGQPALDRLARMLDDSYPNARYNAATGLARHGDERAQIVLVEMLDPNNEQAISGEQREDGRVRKRFDVLVNGISAAARLADTNSSANLGPIKSALDRLAQSDVQRSVRLQASEALHVLAKR